MMYTVKHDESKIGIAWSKGETIEANSPEEAIEKAIANHIEFWMNWNDMVVKDTCLENARDYAAEIEADFRNRNWKAEEIS